MNCSTEIGEWKPEWDKEIRWSQDWRWERDGDVILIFAADAVLVFKP